MIWLVNAKYLKDYKLWIKFNNGEEMEIDLENHLVGEIFEPLKNLKFFKKVRFNSDTDTIEWENGADFAPEFLYEIGKKLSKTA